MTTATEALDTVGNLASIRIAAEELVQRAAVYGVVLTIEQRPLQPLAMTNYETVVDVRPDRRAR